VRCGAQVANRTDMLRTSLVLVAIAAVAVGCTNPMDTGDDDGVTGDDDGGGDDDDGPWPGPDAGAPDAIVPDAGNVDYPYRDLDTGCAPVFAQNLLIEYHVTIPPEHWAQMQDEFLHPEFTPQGTIVEPPYHPAEVQIVEGEVTHEPPDVMIRLNGNTSWLQTIMFDTNPKMQFVIAFNKVDSDGRFQKMRKIKLDMPRSDWTFLQQRVALAWLRGRASVPAQCANSARVYINGEYYGLFTNAEHQDKSFLTRVYGSDNNDGDLWKGGREIKTNEDDFTWDHISAFWDVTDLAGLDALADVDTSMLTWAAEAVIGDPDGYNYGRANFFVYDHPATGKFVWLANDLDTVLDDEYLPPGTTPVLAPAPEGVPRHERDWYHYLLALNDPSGVARYVTALAQQLPKLDPVELAGWIDAWSAQIADAAAEDPRKPFSMSDHVYAVERMKAYSPERVAYLEDWLACWSGGGADVDGDGYDLCHDCNDDVFSQSPGEVEVCDTVDNNCNGWVDDVYGDTCAEPGP
jgi:hypothetical protein